MADRKEYYKQYKQDQKEQINQYAIDYYQLNKDKIRERESAKVICDVCGSTVSRNVMPRHKRTNKCKSLVKPIGNEETTNDQISIEPNSTLVQH